MTTGCPMNVRNTIVTTAVLAAGLVMAARPLAAQGTIEGRVTLTGTPAPNPVIRMGADPNCLQMHPGQRMLQEKVVRAARHKDNIRPVFKRVDSCAAEFGSHTAYLYSTYEEFCEADPTDRQKIMILGGGPNRIGQGIEFD